MWRKHLVATGALMVLLAPALGAQWWNLDTAEQPCSETPEQEGEQSEASSPFGFLNGRPNGTPLTSASGVITLKGWALDDDGVARVDISVDGNVIGQAQYGQKRPRIAQQFPGFPDSEAAGFTFQLDTTRFLNGDHRVNARVWSNIGEIRPLNAAVFDFDNLSHNLRPFGLIEFPDTQAELSGNCNLTDPNRRYAVVEGWVLDAGLENHDHGVGWVELLINGSKFANTRTDCRHDPIQGAYTNCFGIRRDGIEQRYPSLNDARHAGFRFVMDIGVLLNIGYVPGRQTLIVRAGDLDSQVENIDSIIVNFRCDDFFMNEASFGFVRATQPPGPDSGLTLVTGWALDREGVLTVQIFVDGAAVGNALFGFSRPAVASRYPGYFDSDAPGWLFELDTTEFSNGVHEVSAVVRDGLGEEVLIGSQQIFVDN